jgi:segregation and condensation protein A
MAFRVDLEIYRGPLDLLLYLVRKHELEIGSIPLATIAEQYLEHVAVLEKLDVNDVGDFLEIASLLIEMKSRSVLPRVEQPEEEWEDPRDQLVERLLEYKRYKDVASILEERSRQWQQSLPRLANDLPPRHVAPSEQPIHEVELWDLVSALGRIMRHEAAEDTKILYDETPLQVHMQTIYKRLKGGGRLGITEILTAGMHKSAVIGLFLAVLELVRHHSVEAEQEDGDGEIWVRPGPNFDHTLEIGWGEDSPTSDRPRWPGNANSS